GEGFTQQAGRVDNMRSGHRDDAFRVEVRDFSKDHTVTAPTSCDEASHRGLHHFTGHYYSRGSGPIVRPRSGGHASLKSDGAVAGVWIAGMNRGLWIARQSRLGQGQPGTPVPDRASQADPHRNTVPTRPSQTDTW